MRRRRFVETVLLFALIEVAGAWAEEPGETDGNATPFAMAAIAVTGVATHDVAIEPWIHNSMSARVRERLEAGFELAVERVREVETCRNLFTQDGIDGLEVLATSLYFPVDSYRREIEVCGRDPSVHSTGGRFLTYTTVGGAPIWICRHFARVSTETAAVAVIHEALHHAGLTERPNDRLAMSSQEITELVESACGF